MLIYRPSFAEQANNLWSLTVLANTDCLERRKSPIIMRREMNIYHRLQNRLISGHSLCSLIQTV